MAVAASLAAAVRAAPAAKAGAPAAAAAASAAEEAAVIVVGLRLSTMTTSLAAGVAVKASFFFSSFIFFTIYFGMGRDDRFPYSFVCSCRCSRPLWRGETDLTSTGLTDSSGSSQQPLN